MKLIQNLPGGDKVPHDQNKVNGQETGPRAEAKGLPGPMFAQANAAIGLTEQQDVRLEADQAPQKRLAYLWQSLRLWLSCLMEHALLLPVWILFVNYAWPEALSFVWLGGLSLLALAGALLSLRVRKLWQRGMIAVCLGAGYVSLPLVLLPGPGVLGGNIGPASAWAPVIAQAAAFLAAAILSSLQGLTAAAREGQYRLYWAAILVYFIAGMVFPNVPLLSDSVPLLTWAGAVCVAVTLFVTNHQHLRYSLYSTGSHERLPAGLKRHNRLFVAAIAVASLLLAAGAGRWIGGILWGLLRGLVQWLTRSPSPEVVMPEEPAGLPAPPPMLAEEVREPGMLARLLNIVFYAIGGLVIVFLIGLALYWLYRHGGAIWRKAAARLLSLLRREARPSSHQAYHDEEKNIFSWEDALQGWRQSASRLLGVRTAALERWEEMQDSRERVRYLYRLFLRKERERGYSVKSELTPFETIEDVRREQERQAEKWKASGRWRKESARSKGEIWESGEDSGDSVVARLLRLYYPARYGDKPINEEELVELNRRLSR